MFGAVALVGAVGAASMQVMKGPVRAMSEVTKRTIAENNMIASSKLAVMAATNQANGGDCDGDMIVEPMPADAAGGLPTPAGGGLLPATIGASLQDPWNTRYGLCSWDHGPDNGRCGGNDGLIAGGPTEDQYVLAVISAGPDRQFQTTCNAWVDADTDNQPDVPLLAKAPGSDDLVLGYTYAEANNAGGGLWVLKSGDPDKATIVKDLEVRTADDAQVAFSLDRSTGQTEFLAIKTDNIYARTSPNGHVAMGDPLRIKLFTGMAAPTGGGGGGGGGGGAGDNLGDHVATQNVKFFSSAGGGGVNGAEQDPKVGAVTNNKWCRGDGTQIICDQDAPGGGGGDVVQWNPSTVCDASSYGTFTHADDFIHLCSSSGWVTLPIAGSNGPAEPAWTGGYFVAAQLVNGGMGGLSGANAACLDHLTNNPWRGKTDAVERGLLTADKVRAFLCITGGCQNGLPNTSYKMAQSGTQYGGQVFTTDASGLGPGYAMAFAPENDTGFAPGTLVWTARQAGTATLWSNTRYGSSSASYRCGDWNSNNSGYYTMSGIASATSGTSNWAVATHYCDQTARVICFVDP